MNTLKTRLASIFLKRPSQKLCRVAYLSGIVVVCPASIETLSELLFTCASGTEIEVLG